MSDGGRMVPYDEDAERAVISAMLLEPRAVTTVKEILRPEHFFLEPHTRIVDAILAVDALGPVDIVSVASYLRDRQRLAGVGGPGYLATLADKTPAVAHVRHHAAIVLEKWRARALIAAHQLAAAEGYGDVGTSVAAWAEGHLAALRSIVDASSLPSSLVSLESAIGELVTSWRVPALYAPTGINGLDRMLGGGLRAGNVLGVAGAAKSGKSVLAGQVVYDCTDAPNVVGLYASVEMPRAEVISRWITREIFRLSVETGMGHQQGGPDGGLATFAEVFHGVTFRRGRAEDASGADVQMLARLGIASARVASHRNLHAVKISPGSTPGDLRTLVRRARELWASSRPPRTPPPLVVLVVDPVQRLFAGPVGALSGSALERINSDETERMGQVAQQLKVIADEDEIAIVFPSDGTKAGAAAGPQAVTDLRGNYQLNHLATMILGLTSRRPADPSDPRSAAEALAAATGEKGSIAERVRVYLDAMPSWWEGWAGSECALRFGPRPVVIDCSGSRQSDAADLVLGFVRGAQAFVEGNR